MTDDASPARPLALGIEALDREHQGQLEHMVRLEHAIDSGRPEAEVRDLTKDLIQYLEAHFASEQIAMRETAYPAYEDHVREHDEAISLLGRLLDLDRNEWGTALVELRESLVRHVHTTDAAFAGFLTKQSP